MIQIMKQSLLLPILDKKIQVVYTINPRKKPAGINIFHIHQLRVLLERGYY